MDALLLGLAALACPVGMGVMMRGSRGQGSAPRSDGGAAEELARLRAEVEQLREARPTRTSADERR